MNSLYADSQILVVDEIIKNSAQYNDLLVLVAAIANLSFKSQLLCAFKFTSALSKYPVLRISLIVMKI